MESNSGAIGERSFPRDHLVEKFVPSAAWSEDLDAHYLLVDLPEYKKEEVKLQADDYSGQITVSGKRLVNYNKYEYFERAYKAPPNSDMGKITARFDGEILHVTVPKIKPEEKEDSREPHQTRDDHEKAEDNNKENNETGPSCSGACGLNLNGEILKERKASLSPLERAKDFLKRNQIVITAVLAFSVGVFLSRRYQSAGELNELN